MFLQDNDPHHMHPDFNYVYYFLILAVVLTALVLFVGLKVMTFFDNRYERKKPTAKNSETAASIRDESRGDDGE